MKKTTALLCIVGLLAAALPVGCAKKEHIELESVSEGSVSQETNANITSLEGAESDITGQESTDSENSIFLESSGQNVNVASSQNLISNGDFETGSMDPWATFMQDGQATTAVKNNQLVLSISNEGKVEHGVQLYHDGFSLDSGCEYLMECKISSNVPRKVHFRIQLNSGDYHPYVIQTIDVTNKMQTVTVPFTMKEDSDPAPRLCFNLGCIDQTAPIGSHEITIDDVALYLKSDKGKVSSDSNQDLKHVIVDQIGYEPDSKKLVVVRNESAKVISKEFKIIDTKTKKEVFSALLKDSVMNQSAGEYSVCGDFTQFKTPGSYLIQTSGEGESVPFEIKKNLYSDTLPQILKMLYMQRCGCELSKDYAGSFSHPACHMQKARIYGTGQEVTITGGWHDAGDYGRYVVPGAMTMADLLLAYEKYPSAVSFDGTKDFRIPQSGNGIPDILDEIRYEAEFLLRMQAADGGVYHKITCANFPGDVMPEAETDQLVVMPVSSCATGDFAAAMAKFSISYRQYDKQFADQCLHAAKKAYAFLEANPSVISYKNPSDIATGEYPDETDIDERLWAAAELYRATSDTHYLDEFKSHLKKNPPMGLGWQDMGTFGVIAYLDTKAKTDPRLTKQLKDDLINQSHQLIETSNRNGYLISMNDSYGWGSNLTVSNQAMLISLASAYEKKDAAIKAQSVVTDHLHYLFGRNPMAICYVTGMGTTSPKKPHHRVSTVVGVPVPGMLVGGPNSNLEDPYVASALAGKAPAKCYADHVQSYSTNEVAIYWNSPLLYLLAAEQAE